MVGFDLVGQEDLGRPLLDFAEDLMAARDRDPNLNYYFHAGIFIKNARSLKNELKTYYFFKRRDRLAGTRDRPQRNGRSPFRNQADRARIRHHKSEFKFRFKIVFPT